MIELKPLVYFKSKQGLNHMFATSVHGMIQFSVCLNQQTALAWYKQHNIKHITTM